MTQTIQIAQYVLKIQVYYLIIHVHHVQQIITGLWIKLVNSKYVVMVL